MTSSHFNILDLPEEIILYIFNKLHNLDVLYSLLGSNCKLDAIACDKIFTQSIDLARLVSDEKDNVKAKEILDEFCSQILPRIHQNIQCLTIDPCWLEYILDTKKFSNLHRLNLTDINVVTASRIFLETNSTIIKCKDQIHELNLTIDNQNSSTFNLLVDIYRQIFCLFTNLTNLYLDINSRFVLLKSLLDNLPSTTCSSLTITHLNIKLYNIDDCFLLLDGRLSKLHTLIVKLDFIHDQELLRRLPLETLCHSIILSDKTKNFEKLKSFSLILLNLTDEFDTLIVRFLRRMVHLETLSLSLRLYQRDTFIDYTYLENIFLKNLLCLQNFHFDIVVDNVIIHDDTKPCFSDIQQTFIEKGYHTDGYLDYANRSVGLWSQCHIYSLPFMFEYMQPITNCFPGGLFKSVTVLWLKDKHHSFERKFFVKISQSFPFIRRLTITNQLEQKQKTKDLSSIIKFFHLIELCFGNVHINYVEQFLSSLITYLPALIKLTVAHEHLSTITENFISDVTRINCAKLKSISFTDVQSTVHSQDFYHYFPSLNLSV